MRLQEFSAAKDADGQLRTDGIGFDSKPCADFCVGQTVDFFEDENLPATRWQGFYGLFEQPQLLLTIDGFRCPRLLVVNIEFFQIVDCLNLHDPFTAHQIDGRIAGHREQQRFGRVNGAFFARSKKTCEGFLNQIVDIVKLREPNFQVHAQGCLVGLHLVKKPICQRRVGGGA